MNSNAVPKKLFLLRHAKSSWSDAALSDFERTLNARGRNARIAMAKYIDQQGYRPEVIICSTAKRAQMTLDAIRPVVGEASRIELDEGLYLAEPKALVRRVAQLAPSVGSVMLIGHNPGLHMLALTLAIPSDAEAYHALHRKYPTAALCVLQGIQPGWNSMSPESYDLLDFTVPRSLGAS